MTDVSTLSHLQPLNTPLWIQPIARKHISSYVYFDLESSSDECLITFPNSILVNFEEIMSTFHRYIF